MDEEVKRLSPTSAVLRELFLKSGNQCAFPGCFESIVDEEGNYVGEICHIEAAEKGGERFNPNMTNEDRRAFDNLMLMCHKHHVVTNDVEKYPVTELKKMKKVHENKFSNVIQQMQNSIVDYGRANIYIESQVCTKLSNILGYGCSLEENAENSRVLNKLLLKLLDLPIETRMLLSIMVSRSYKDRVGDCCVPLHEIESATGKTSMYIIQQVDILNRRAIISTPDTDEYGCPYCKLYGDFETDWNYWNDIREFCRKTGILFDTICVKLDFSVFD